MSLLAQKMFLQWPNLANSCTIIIYELATQLMVQPKVKSSKKPKIINPKLAD